MNVVLSVLCVTLAAWATEPAVEPVAAEAAREASAAAGQPKPLSEHVKRGLAWLAQHQLPSGAWGQGEESAHMGGGGTLKDAPSVADTCMATMALIRAGHTPDEGAHAKNVRGAVEFICGQVEESDADSLFVTKQRGMRVQQKLGQYIDTFMACTLLAEVQEKTADRKLLERITAALNKVVRKIEKNQRDDGTWGDRGWAQSLEQQMAVKALNKAARGGAKVDETVRERATEESKGRFDAKSGEFAGKGSAGVSLYAAASSLGGQQESANTDALREPALRDKAENAATESERKEARAQLAKIQENREVLQATTQAVVKKLGDDRFIAGFGSNGGEEFLSYLTIGESLVVRGGEEWTKWDKKITDNLNHIQNRDGSWTGHHCITGRTFCTSAALLVLMVDRTPVPIAAKMTQR